MVIINEWALLDIKYVNLRPSEEEIAGWKLLDTKWVTLAPSEEEIAGWKLLDTKFVTLVPSTEEISGWKLLKTESVTLKPHGLPSVCTVDADCPPGYKCVNGKCVKEEEEKPFAWEWVLAGVLGVGGLILLIPKKKKKTEKT